MLNVQSLLPRFKFFDAPIQLRLIYALISSLLWWAISENASSLGLSSEQSAVWAAGAVFGALVLVPYLPSLKGISMLRALGLLVCGALSYWTAIYVFDSVGVPGMEFLGDLSGILGKMHALGIVGIVGAAIVGIGARLLVPLAIRWGGWLMLVGAGSLGGIVLGISFDASIGAWGDIDHKYWLPGHIAWQVLVCLALYYGSNRSSRAAGIAGFYPVSTDG